MKSDKSPLKKKIKAVTASIREKSAAVAARIKPAKAAAKAKVKAPAPKPAPAKTSQPTVKKKVLAKTTVPPVPAILLEGDRPAAMPTGGPGQRYALGPVPPTPHLGFTEATGELPAAYGTQRLLLTARDPHWLYAGWDLTREQQRGYNARSVDRHLVLRIFINEVKGQPAAQVHVHPESTHWFIPVAQAGAKYLAELGYYAVNGQWVTISTSGTTLTPPEEMSEDTSVQFATIPIEIPFSQIMEFARIAVQQNIPLVEVLQQLRASGYHFPEVRGVEKWTPERERALAAIITMDRVRRVWMGSLEITELIRRQMQSETSSLGVAQFSLPTSPLGGVSSMSSLSSPFGGEKRNKGFWFNVNAELIIYGATEPDAQVTIGGRVIKLRGDGTFSYRFILPDGQYELPAVAISSDKTDGRAAELRFGRSTEYRGDVGAHPQDPQLNPPLAKHVA